MWIGLSMLAHGSSVSASENFELKLNESITVGAAKTDPVTVELTHQVVESYQTEPDGPTHMGVAMRLVVTDGNTSTPLELWASADVKASPSTGWAGPVRITVHNTGMTGATFSAQRTGKPIGDSTPHVLNPVDWVDIGGAKARSGTMGKSADLAFLLVPIEIQAPHSPKPEGFGLRLGSGTASFQWQDRVFTVRDARYGANTVTLDARRVEMVPLQPLPH